MLSAQTCSRVRRGLSRRNRSGDDRLRIRNPYFFLFSQNEFRFRPTGARQVGEKSSLHQLREFVLSLRLRKANVLPFGVVPMTRLRLSSSPLKLPNWVKNEASTHRRRTASRRGQQATARATRGRERYKEGNSHFVVTRGASRLNFPLPIGWSRHGTRWMRW